MNCVPNNIEDYLDLEKNVSHEMVHKLPHVKIVWADYKKIIEDFPYLFELWTEDKKITLEMIEKIDNWLIHHAGIMSQSQLQFVGEGGACQMKKAYRPVRYGRAVIVQLSDDPLIKGDEKGGMLDIKGAGVSPDRIPDSTFHSSGVLPLPYALQEVINQKIVEEIFRKLDLDVSGVPVYAVINTGIDFSIPEPPWGKNKPFSEKVPAGLLIRQAHIRQPGNNELPNSNSDLQRVYLNIELILRAHGMTSCTGGSRLQLSKRNGILNVQYGGKSYEDPEFCLSLENFIKKFNFEPPIEFDVLNIQATRFFTFEPLRVKLVDFGQYVVAPKFNNPLLVLVNDRPFNWGGVINKGAKNWIDIDKECCINMDFNTYETPDFESAGWAGLDSEYIMSKSLRIAFKIVGEVLSNKMTSEQIDIQIHDYLFKSFN